MKYLFALLFLTASCSKNGDDAGEFEFSFTYVGTEYRAEQNNSQRTGSIVSSNVGRAIYIDFPGVFMGRIYFYDQGCAYQEDGFPGLKSIDVKYPGCILKAIELNGNLVPIDSSKVFIYKSGQQNIQFLNCESKKEYDGWTGTYHTHTYCTVRGTFDLELVNKQNQVIKITNGKINIPRMQL